MSSIARTALVALVRARGTNTAGEIEGGGPPWACPEYAKAGHNYLACTDCLENFQRRMNIREAA